VVSSFTLVFFLPVEQFFPCPRLAFSYNPIRRLNSWHQGLTWLLVLFSPLNCLPGPIGSRFMFEMPKSLPPFFSSPLWSFPSLWPFQLSSGSQGPQFHSKLEPSMEIPPHVSCESSFPLPPFLWRSVFVHGTFQVSTLRSFLFQVLKVTVRVHYV